MGGYIALALPADTRTGSPGWCSSTPAAAPTTTPRCERRRAVGGQRADRGEIAAGPRRDRPARSPRRRPQTSGPRLAEIAGAVPAGHRSRGRSGRWPRGRIPPQLLAGAARAGAGGGGGAGRRSRRPRWPGRWSRRLATGGGTVDTRAARRRAPDSRRGPGRFRRRAVLGWWRPRFCPGASDPVAGGRMGNPTQQRSIDFEPSPAALSREPHELVAHAAGQAVALRGLTKSFGGRTVVDHIDLDVPAGSFFGLVGPNGAGKTTTLSMVTGLLRPDAGRVIVAGRGRVGRPRRGEGPDGRAAGRPAAVRAALRAGAAQLPRPAAGAARGRGDGPVHGAAHRARPRRRGQQARRRLLDRHAQEDHPGRGDAARAGGAAAGRAAGGG